LYINHVTFIARNLFYKFKLLRDILNLKILCTVYLALVQFILSYGIVVWGNASKIALNPIAIITLNSLLRLILIKPYDFHVINLYTTLNVRDLNDLYLLKILKFIFIVNLEDYSLSHSYSTSLNKRG